MEPLLRLIDSVDRLPEWLQPIAYGPLLVATWMTAKGILVIGPILVIVGLWQSEDRLRTLASGALVLAIVFAAAALGGLAYSLVGRPINRSFRFGWLLAGWVTMMPYFVGVALVVRTTNGVPLLAPFGRPEWSVVGIMTLIFGSQIGYMVLRPGAMD